MPVQRPRIIVNLKTYPQATGAGMVRIAEAAATVAETTGVGIAVAPQALDVRMAMGHDVPVYAQHFDRVEGGSQTGWTSLEHLVGAGVSGSLINHSEHRVSADDVAWAVAAARAARIVGVVCTKDAAESATYARFTPDMVAVEPPELIGGDVSVTTADPAVVSATVDAVSSVAPGVEVLCGAGGKVRKDVETAVDLGAFGILLASGVTKAADAIVVLEDLARGF